MTDEASKGGKVIAAKFRGEAVTTQDFPTDTTKWVIIDDRPVLQRLVMREQYCNNRCVGRHQVWIDVEILPEAQTAEVTDFTTLPLTEGEKQAAKTRHPTDWSARDMLIDCLRQIDGGRAFAAATRCVIVFGKVDERGNPSVIVNKAGIPNGAELIGWLECAIKEELGR